MNMWTISTVTIGLAVFAVINFTSGPDDIAMQYGSHEERVLRYVSKMELNKDNPVWQNAVAVQKAKQGAELKTELVRDIFVEQEIMTAAEFDVALQNLRDWGLVNNALLKPTEKGLEMHQALVAAQAELTVAPK